MEGKYRFLVEHEKGGYHVKIIPKEQAQNWIRGNPKAILLRYAAATNAGNIPCDTKEEAMEIVAKDGGRVQVIRPNQAIFNKLPEQAIQLLYQA